MIIDCYPDRGNTPPGYLAAVQGALAEFAPDIQNRIADRRHGLPAKCKFLPTVAEIVEMGTEIEKYQREMAELRSRPRMTPYTPDRIRAPVRPFPQLWKAFGDDRMDDLAKAGKGTPFEVLADANRKLVTEGREAARSYLSLATGCELV